MKSQMQIGAAARAAGVHVQTLRYYERRGLLPRPRRSRGNYRTYDDAAVRRVRAIKRAQQLGFTLEQVGELDRIRSGCSSAGRLESLAKEKLAEIDGKLADLRRMRRKLREVVETCACGGDPGLCDVLAELGSSRGGK